ncbi:MAG TPA: hypothetical protein VLH09_09355, partial [Bryobacteraceae bacterium]|nr:hypothetical protein [Bryobacteraceae bacterium]
VPPRPEPVLMAKRQELPEMPPPAATPPAAARTVKQTPPAPAESKRVPAEKVKVEVAAAEPVSVERAQVKVAPPEPARVEMADREPELERLAAGQVAVRASAALSTFRQAEADALPSPIPYRVLRGDAAGDFKDTAATAPFTLDDRLRVIFEPGQAGRLRVVSSSSKILFDRDVEGGVSVPLDVPPGETRLTGAFHNIPFQIQLRRQP